jgi:poly [ADP-ribose] polymerase
LHVVDDGADGETTNAQEGVKVPCGKPVASGAVGSSLLYNEYIVYDVGQINIKYLLKVKFNYK